MRAYIGLQNPILESDFAAAEAQHAGALRSARRQHNIRLRFGTEDVIALMQPEQARDRKPSIRRFERRFIRGAPFRGLVHVRYAPVRCTGRCGEQSTRREQNREPHDLFQLRKIGRAP